MIVDPKRPAEQRKRRTYTEEQRLEILKEASLPGVSVAAVARQFGINDNMIYTWRKQRSESLPRMLPVSVSTAAIAPIQASGAITCGDVPIEIRTANGHVISIGAGADTRMVQTVLAAVLHG